MLMLSHFFSPLFHHTCHMSFPYTRTCMTNTKFYQMFRLHQRFGCPRWQHRDCKYHRIVKGVKKSNDFLMKMLIQFGEYFAQLLYLTFSHNDSL